MVEPLYYESHVTIEPVFDGRLDILRGICEHYNFRVADLVMLKTPLGPASPSMRDTFCSSRDSDIAPLKFRMDSFVEALRKHGYEVWRKKIEAVVIDDRFSRKKGEADR